MDTIVKRGFIYSALGFSLFTLGTLLSTRYVDLARAAFALNDEVSYDQNIGIADFLFGIGLASGLLSISIGCAEIAKPYPKWYIFFMMVVALAFMYLGKEITKTAHEYIKLHYWIAFGVIIYGTILIYKTNKKKYA